MNVHNPFSTQIRLVLSAGEKDGITDLLIGRPAGLVGPQKDLTEVKNERLAQH